MLNPVALQKRLLYFRGRCGLLIFEVWSIGDIGFDKAPQ
jgi:hypothetical protein